MALIQIWSFFLLKKIANEFARRQALPLFLGLIYGFWGGAYAEDKHHDVSVYPAFFEKYGVANAPLQSAWMYRSLSERFCALSLSPRFAAVSQATIGSLTDAEKRDFISWQLKRRINGKVWWEPGSALSGDPNVNRFVLFPLLEMAYSIKNHLPRSGLDNIDPILVELRISVDFQLQVYQGQVAWDKQTMTYPNQDIYFALIMTLAARLYDQPLYQEWADKAIVSIKQAMAVNGGFYYIGNENPSPIYQALLQIMLARYYQVTGDDSVLGMLKTSAGYWLYSMSDEGVVEAWSDAWWKQIWLPIPAAALRISAGVTGNGELEARYLSLLGADTPKSTDFWWQYSLPWHDEEIKPADSANHFVRKDKAIRGVRARSGNWYYGITQGAGLRNTFVGGMITSKRKSALDVAFRGAQIEVIESRSKSRHGFWLSQKNDRTDMLVQHSTAAMAAAYTLQLSTINSSSDIKTPDSPWQVRQLWAIKRNGLMGSITVRAAVAAEGIRIIGRLPLGPCEIRKVSERDWACGQLRVRFYSAFGSVPVVVPMPAENPSHVDKWPGLLLQQNYEHITAGQTFSYIVWIGPDSAEPPDDINMVSSGEEWRAKWKDGGNLRVRYAPEAGRVSFSH